MNDSLEKRINRLEKEVGIKEEAVPKYPKLLEKRYDFDQINQIKNDIGAIFIKYDLSVEEARTLILTILQVINDVSNKAHLWTLKNQQSK